MALSLLLWAGVAAATVPSSCQSYTTYAAGYHGPYTGGTYNLSYQRPAPECRTTSFAEVEETITDMKAVIKDPDLYRLFENSFPNTLDTTVAWQGFSADNANEEVCITTRVDRTWLTDDSSHSLSLGISTPCGCEIAPTNSRATKGC